MQGCATAVRDEIQNRLTSILHNCSAQARSLWVLKKDCEKIEADGASRIAELEERRSTEAELKDHVNKKRELYLQLLKQRETFASQVQDLRRTNLANAKKLESLEQQMQQTQHLYEEAFQTRIQREHAVSKAQSQLDATISETSHLTVQAEQIGGTIAKINQKSERLRTRLTTLLLSADQSLRSCTFPSPVPK
ncbi:hypothetical protein PAPYR_4300 [Paratrimastix pyriformis]|uniref:Uncharacterized protein n=1 Tax=Paratrimastix pyriformis TaxID=342808 RepID=A0ABQ8UM87_9EUKA|nr:hypothetical protein PAPYR_4300 [Paratrimastix pyriformis]